MKTFIATVMCAIVFFVVIPDAAVAEERRYSDEIMQETARMFIELRVAMQDFDNITKNKSKEEIATLAKSLKQTGETVAKILETGTRGDALIFLETLKQENPEIFGKFLLELLTPTAPRVET